MSPPRYEPVRCPCQHRYVPYNRSTRYCLFHLMCIRILLLLTVFGRRWCGNDGGIHYRSLFQNEASFHKCGNHLREQLFLQSVLDQQIAKTAKGIAVRNLIAGIDAAEIRKRTAGSGIAIPSTGRSVRAESETLFSLSGLRFALSVRYCPMFFSQIACCIFSLRRIKVRR